jgi:hypothetical protein
MPQPKEFLAAMEGRKVLFITAFDEQINYLFNSDKIFHLYKNFKTKPFHLKAIKAPMSLYPFRPNRSWHKSLSEYQNLIEEIVDKGNFDYVIVSAGSYGVPLAHFANESLGVPSFYGGHGVNSWFGVITQSTPPPSDAILSNWSSGDLEHMKDVFSRIDGGRYLGPNQR